MKHTISDKCARDIRIALGELIELLVPVYDVVGQNGELIVSHPSLNYARSALELLQAETKVQA